jgi:hypothetical protein
MRGWGGSWPRAWPGLGWARPSEKALRDLRRRLGSAPLKALFEVGAGPLAEPHTPGVRFAGRRTVAFDGCNSVKIPGTGRNRSWTGRVRCRVSWAGYPTLRLMALAETGTRALLGAAAGSVTGRDETALATRLLPLLGPGMLVLPGRGFDATWFFKQIARTGAMLVCRACSSRNPHVREHLSGGTPPGTSPGRASFTTAREAGGTRAYLMRRAPGHRRGRAAGPRTPSHLPMPTATSMFSPNSRLRLEIDSTPQPGPARSPAKKFRPTSTTPASLTAATNSSTRGTDVSNGHQNSTAVGQVSQRVI